MPDIKEKPVMGKPKARDKAALLPQQAGRLMKEKYLRQLDQHPPGEEDGTEYATGQVEDSARRAVDELASNAPRRPLKERRYADPPRPSAAATEGEPPRTEHDPPRNRPANAPKERGAAPPETTAAPKERPTAHAVKERMATRPTQRATAEHPAALSVQEPKSAPAAVRSDKAVHPPAKTTLNNRRRSSATLHPPTVGTVPQSAQPLSPIPKPPPVEPSAGGVAMPERRYASVKERVSASRTGIKTRAAVSTKKPPVGRTPAPKLKPATAQAAAKQTVCKTRQATQQHMKRRMVAQAQKAARSAAALTKQVAVAVAKAVAALVGSLVGLIGGGFLLIALVIVIVIAAVANSPFGLFFAAEKNAPDTVSVSEAVATVNVAYNATLEELQAGDYDSIVIHGQAPVWPDVLAVFAVKLAGADMDGLDVATLDADRVDKLTAVFWDMTVITTRVEEIYHPGSGEDDPGWTECILHITITAKTADEMREVYRFTPYQNSALDELLVDRAALSALAGSLTITNADVSAVLDTLPADLSPERREAVRVALTLVGKVNYFWGGKSHAIGWDSRWGTLQKVWAEGSSTTGTYRPYGLDCSGYVDWIFNNSMGYIIGHGGGVIMQHTYCTDISPSEAQPGDLAFFPDDSHIGMVVGRSESGGILVAHCSSGQNNVVITEYTATGFTALGRPDVFD